LLLKTTDWRRQVTRVVESHADRCKIRYMAGLKAGRRREGNGSGRIGTDICCGPLRGGPWRRYLDTMESGDGSRGRVPGYLPAASRPPGLAAREGGRLKVRTQRCSRCVGMGEMDRELRRRQRPLGRRWTRSRRKSVEVPSRGTRRGMGDAHCAYARFMASASDDASRSSSPCS